MRQAIRPIMAVAALCGATILPAQQAPDARRTPLTVGMVGSAFQYDRNASLGFTGTERPLAGGVGFTLGWGGTPRWLDIESRLTLSRVGEGPYAIRNEFTPGVGLTPVFGTPLEPWLLQAEHQFAVITPGPGLRPFAGALIGNRILRGSTSEQGVMNSFSLGVALGARLERQDGRSVGLGYRIRDSYVTPKFTREVTFDVRVPIR